MVSEIVCIFVCGHLSLWKDVRNNIDRLLGEYPLVRKGYLGLTHKPVTPYEGACHKQAKDTVYIFVRGHLLPLSKL